MLFAQISARDLVSQKKTSAGSLGILPSKSGSSSKSSNQICEPVPLDIDLLGGSSQLVSVIITSDKPSCSWTNPTFLCSLTCKPRDNRDEPALQLWNQIGQTYRQMCLKPLFFPDNDLQFCWVKSTSNWQKLEANSDYVNY